MTKSDFNQQMAEDIQAARKAEDCEDYLDKYFTEPAGYFWTRIFMKLHWTPNAVSILSMLCGIAGGILFLRHNIVLNIVGFLLEILSAILDCTDGQLARLTNQRSELGRFLDGAATYCSYISIYLCVGIRIMTEDIPFTNQAWGFWIWPLIILGSLCHGRQCMMADYYRNLHLFFENQKNGNEFERYKDLLAQKEENQKKGFISRFYMAIYYPYTRSQESATPNLQRLLQAFDENNGEYSEELRQDFITESRKYVQLTNLLTYNLRAYVLFTLLIFDYQIYYWAFLIVIMGLMNVFMVYQYERIAKNLFRKYYQQEGGNK